MEEGSQNIDILVSQWEDKSVNVNHVTQGTVAKQPLTRAVNHGYVTPTDLMAVGKFLYGGGWQTALAKDLHVADRTVRAWLAGKQQMCSEHFKDLVGLVADEVHERVFEALDRTDFNNKDIGLMMYKNDMQLRHGWRWDFDCAVTLRLNNLTIGE